MNERTAWRPEVFEFLDLRQFLAAWQEAARDAGAGDAYSFTRLAQMAGLKAKSHMYAIFKGTRSLAPERARELGRRLFRSVDEERRREASIQYLVLLAELDAARGDDAFATLQAALATRRKHRSSQQQPADPDALRYLGDWWAFPLRQLTHVVDFEPTARWIRKRVWLARTARAIARDLAEAEASGLLARDDNGRLVASASITTGHDLAQAGYTREVRLAAGRLHREALDVVKRSIEAVDSGDRVLQLKFLAVPWARLDDFRARFAALIDEFDQEEGGETVFQIHLSAVPLTKRGRR